MVGLLFELLMCTKMYTRRTSKHASMATTFKVSVLGFFEFVVLLALLMLKVVLAEGGAETTATAGSAIVGAAFWGVLVAAPIAAA